MPWFRKNQGKIEPVRYRTASDSERDKASTFDKEIAAAASNPFLTRNLSFDPARYRSRFCNFSGHIARSTHRIPDSPNPTRIEVAIKSLYDDLRSSPTRRNQ